jgi:hypothetical protein
MAWTHQKFDADIYREYVIKTGVPDYAAIVGNKGIQIWQRKDGDITHIWTVTGGQIMKALKHSSGSIFQGQIL